MSESNERLAQLVNQLRQQPGLADTMPDPEGAVVRAALAGDDVYAIAQQYSMSEKAVWDTLGNAARAAAGQPAAQVETGGLGSDTDPGVTGGYGDTGFGSLGTEPPVAIPRSPARHARKSWAGIDLAHDKVTRGCLPLSPCHTQWLFRGMSLTGSGRLL